VTLNKILTLKADLHRQHQHTLIIAFRTCFPALSANLHRVAESVSSVENIGQKTIDGKSRVAFKEKRELLLFGHSLFSRWGEHVS
jgi:hypothetical protein